MSDITILIDTKTFKRFISQYLSPNIANLNAG